MNNTVYRDLKSNSYINSFFMPQNTEVKYEYIEPVQSIAWILSEQQCRVINGYNSQEATATHYGRQWSVRFTPEIPIDCGFWQFNGLPGAIVEPYDEQRHYHFKPHEVLVRRGQIVKYKLPTRKTTRDKFRAIEIRCYKAPLLHAKGNDFYYVKMDLYGNTTLVEESTFIDISYKPIEVEQRLLARNKKSKSHLLAHM